MTRAIRDVLERGAPTGLEAELHFEELRAREKTPLLAQLWSGAQRGSHILHMSQAALTRDVGVGGPTGAASMIGEKRPVISPLLTFSSCVAAGATVLENLKENHVLATVTKLGEPQWLPEIGGFVPTATSDATFASIPLTPRRVCGEIWVSKQLLIQGGPTLDNLLLTDLSRAASSQLDFMCLYGNPEVFPNQPRGILTTPNRHILPIDWNAPNFEDFVEAERLCEIENVDLGNFHYIMSPDSKAILRSRAIWQAGAGDRSIFEVITGPISSNVVTDERVFFGQFGAGMMTIGIWAVDLVVNPHTRAMDGMTQLIVNMFASLAIRNGRCFGVFDPAAPPLPLRGATHPSKEKPAGEPILKGSGSVAAIAAGKLKGAFR